MFFAERRGSAYMSAQLIVCIVIFLLTCVLYMSGAWSLATVAMASVAALTFFGCLTAGDALSYFSNNTVIMVGAMSVVAAGFSRTRFCSELAGAISRLARGKISTVFLLYCIVAMLLGQMVQSPVIVFEIVAPFCFSFADSTGISRSKIALPLGVVAIATCCTLPIGNGATQAAEFNSYISAFYDHLDGYSKAAPVMGFFDPMKGRLPMLVFTVLYCAFVMPHFCNDRQIVETDDFKRNAAGNHGSKQSLSVLSEIAGIAVFFATALGLMLQAYVLSFLAVWQICLTGAVCMVIFRVLTPSEAVLSVPLSMLLLIVGTLAMAGALSATGAGELIGDVIAGFNVISKNSYIIGLVFFLLTFVLAQFMSNRGTMLILYPIAIATCNKINADPRGLLILIEAGALTAFMTPMPTAAVPAMMEGGGYSQKDIVRGGWLFAVLSCAICVGWIMTIFPIVII